MTRRRGALATSLFATAVLACSAEAPEDWDGIGPDGTGGQPVLGSGASTGSGGAIAPAAGGSTGGLSSSGGTFGSGGSSGGSNGVATGGNPDGSGNGGAGAAGGSGSDGAGGAGSGAGGSGVGGSGVGGWGADGNGAGGAGSGGTDSGGTSSGGAEQGVGGTGNPGTDCEFSGHLEYTFNNFDSWPNDVQERLPDVIEEAVGRYNCYADFTKELTINYKADVPTAEANVDGWISFGSSPAYQVLATAMHEIAHTLGVGYSPWSELTQDGRWVGSHVVEFMTSLPANERDPDAYSQRDYITADSQHFWPYGLNQASEHQSEWSLINHVRIVYAMHLDKQEYQNAP